MDFIDLGRSPSTPLQVYIRGFDCEVLSAANQSSVHMRTFNKCSWTNSTIFDFAGQNNTTLWPFWKVLMSLFSEPLLFSCLSFLWCNLLWSARFKWKIRQPQRESSGTFRKKDIMKLKWELFIGRQKTMISSYYVLNKKRWESDDGSVT